MFNQKKKKKTQQNTQYCYKDFSINVSSWALKPNVIHELQRSSIHQTWLWLWGLHLLVSTACITVIHTGTRCKPAWEFITGHSSIIKWKCHMFSFFDFFFFFFSDFYKIKNAKRYQSYYYWKLLLVCKPFTFFPIWWLNHKFYVRRNSSACRGIKICMYKPCFF